MYCANCGKYNPEDSNFCEHCGSKLIKKEQDSDKSSKKVKAGLTGWLALLGLGLLITPVLGISGLLKYPPLFNQTYDIPGYMSLLQYEFWGLIILTIAGVYLIFLYFKKKRTFPTYYIIFQIADIAYVVLDHIWLSGLVAPTTEQQQVITDTLSQNMGVLLRTIIFSFLWILYVKNSKKVKATFVNEG